MFGLAMQPMPLDLARGLSAAAAREGVSPARWLRTALDTFGGAPGLAASVAAQRTPRSSPPPRSAARAAPRPAPAPRMEFCDDCDREIGGTVSRCKCHDPKIPPAPLVGFAWQAWNLTPRAQKADPIWATRLAQAQGHVRTYGTGLAFLCDPIAQGNTLDATAERLGRSLDAAKAAGARSLLVAVNSIGGDVREGLAMIAMLEKFSKEVGPTIAYVSGCAHSMAAVVTVSCDYAIAAPGASLHVHGVSGGTDEHRAILSDRLASILTARTLVPESHIRGWMQTEIPLSAYDAHSHGFVDEVADGNRAHEIARTVRGPGRHAAFVSDSTAWGSWRRRTLQERAYAPQGKGGAR